MVIGSGLVAKAFSSYRNQDRFIIFASGVSDSKSANPADFEREFTLLKEIQRTNPEKIFVYFSTCSVDDPDLKNTAYITHKLKIEEYIKGTCSRYHIFRVSNLVGNTGNPATIVNYLYNQITEGKNFLLWENAVRNLIDVDDMFRIGDHILQNELFKNGVINIANPENYSVKDIVAALESVTGRKALYTAIARGTPFRIDTSQILPLLAGLPVSFGKSYLSHLINKYYTGR